MYQRIILKDSDIKEITVGNNTLPTVLNISSQIASDIQKKEEPKTFNAHYYTDKDPVLKSVGLTQKLLYGTIGDNKYEFGIDFYILNLLNKNDSFWNDQLFTEIIEFYKKYYNHNENNQLNILKWIKWIYNDKYATIDRKILLDDFYVYELNDYSYQAMTVNNYDYDVKVFYNEINSKSKTIENEIYKMPHSLLAILKSYTYKKAWILIDKSLLNEQNINSESFQINKIIIDFKYKINNFENINKEWNIAGLFNTFDSLSLYHDQILFDQQENYHILNKQNDYFNIYYNNNNNEDIYKDPTRIEKLILSDGKPNISKELDKFRFKFYDNYSETIQKYDNNLSYEIYEFDKNNIFHGQRSLKSSPNKYYEVFPIAANMVHYIFENNFSDIPSLQKAMKKKHYYLYNYKIKYINTFSCNSKNYTEIYIPIPYTDIVNKIEVEDLPTAENIILPRDIKFQGSFYDPENLDSQGLKSSNTLLPYYYVDTFIDKVNGAPYIIDANVEDKDNSNYVLDYRNTLINDFDVRAYTNKELKHENTSIVLTDSENNNFVNIRENLNFTEPTEIDKQMNFICKNLYKLIPTVEDENTSNINTPILISDCFFIYIKNITNVTKIIKYYSTTSSTDTIACYITPVNNTLIIPSEENLIKIKVLDNTFKSDITYYKAY